MRRFVRDNGLSLFFLVLFLAALIGQSFVGLANNNEELVRHGGAAISYGQFVTSSAFLVDVAENWQSEFLQFFLFIFATIWLVQKGSPESKDPGDEGPGSDADQHVGSEALPDSPRWARAGGWRQAVYSNSLLLVMGTIFLLSWFAQSVGGVTVANEENAQHGMPTRDLARLCRLARVLEPDPAELAVRVPRRRRDGRLRDLPPPTRLQRIEAGRNAPPHDLRRIRVGPSQRPVTATTPRARPRHPEPRCRRRRC